MVGWLVGFGVVTDERWLAKGKVKGGVSMNKWNSGSFLYPSSLAQAWWTGWITPRMSSFPSSPLPSHLVQLNLCQLASSRLDPNSHPPHRDHPPKLSQQASANKRVRDPPPAPLRHSRPCRGCSLALEPASGKRRSWAMCLSWSSSRLLRSHRLVQAFGCRYVRGW